MATTVRDLMTTDPIVLDASTTLSNAARTMRDQDIGDVLIKVDQSYGIITDRDIVIRAIAEDLDPHTVTLGAIATMDLTIVAPDDSLDDVVRDMRSHRIRRIPVMDEATPVGILSIGDLAVMRDPESALADISASPSDR